MSANAELMSAHEIRAEEVRSKINDVKEGIEVGYAELAQLLFEVHEKGYFIHYGYESFRDYAEQELWIKYRKARYLVVIAGAVAKANVSWDRVTSIGWTKMRTIAKLLTSSNADEWLDRAENCTQDQLIEMTKNTKPGESSLDLEETPKIHTLQLRMNEDQASIIMDAAEHAKRICDSSNTVDALEHICYDWMQSSSEGPSKTDLSKVINWIEKAYGVRLTPEGPQNLDDLLYENPDEIIEVKE